MPKWHNCQLYWGVTAWLLGIACIIKRLFEYGCMLVRINIILLYFLFSWLRNKRYLIPQALHSGVPSSASLHNGVLTALQDAQCFSIIGKKKKTLQFAIEIFISKYLFRFPSTITNILNLNVKCHVKFKSDQNKNFTRIKNIYCI